MYITYVAEESHSSIFRYDSVRRVVDGQEIVWNHDFNAEKLQVKDRISCMI